MPNRLGSVLSALSIHLGPNTNFATPADPNGYLIQEANAVAVLQGSGSPPASPNPGGSVVVTNSISSSVTSLNVDTPLMGTIARLPQSSELARSGSTRQMGAGVAGVAPIAGSGADSSGSVSSPR